MTKRFKYKLPPGKGCILFVLFSLVTFFPASAQDESLLRPLIREADLKKIDKAESYKSDADKLIEESSQLNMEALAVQADPDLNEKTIAKKVPQLESQAQQKQVQASVFYEKCNELKFTVYKQYIDEFWKANAGQESNYLNAKLLEEQASDNYFQGISYRIEAKRMDEGYAKIEKLAEANNIENQAIQKQLTALSVYHHIAVAETLVEDPVEEIPTRVEAPPAENVPEETPALVEAPPAEDVPEEVPTLVEAPPAIPEAVETMPSTAEEITRPENVEINLSTGLVFRIQVAESRVPLTTGQLRKIYTGDYSLEMIAEDGWYKYQFMGVRLYSDAMQLIKNVNTRGAFIVAYENGIKLNLEEAVKMNNDLENSVRSMGRKGLIEEIEFHLQLAASRAAMLPEEIKALYLGSEPVAVLYEDGWFKYHLKAGNSPEMAAQFKESCAVPNAFLIAYKRAAKIGYYQALRDLK